MAVPKVIPELGSGTTVEFRFDNSAGKGHMEVQDKAFVAIDDSGDWQGASGCTTVAAVPVPTMADLDPGQSEIAATWTGQLTIPGLEVGPFSADLRRLVRHCWLTERQCP